MSTTTAPQGDICPDPSVHERKDQLSAAASTAALYATREKESPLGSDGRLSSKSAATSMRYANAQDLPSFPSRGGLSSADAGKAATMSKDYRMQELWQPEQSTAGSKAALLAAKNGGKLDLWEATPSSAGHSAATLAMQRKGLSPELDRGHTDVGRNNSLLAATKSLGRQRAGSMPVSAPSKYPDSQNPSRNALNAATVSHRASVRNTTDGWNSDANQAARIGNANFDRNLLKEDPHIQYQEDIDEQRHQAALHASAASFAKSLYVVQKRGEVDPETSSLHDDDQPNVGAAGARTAHTRNASAVTTNPNLREEAMRYIHLQDAAHKLAQERLAKVDKEMEAGKYWEYYGYPSKSQRKSRRSMRSSVPGDRNGGDRKRAASEGRGRRLSNDSDSDDEVQAQRIRRQMSQLNTASNTVSDKQRTEDRAKLMAAAEKRVHAQMSSMDNKMFMETGKPTQAMMDEWETKAREKAERDRVDRERHPGKTHIGGGKYMDDADINAIAAARLKPTLDELNDTAEKKRARDEEFRVQRDRQETERMEEKMRSSEQKAEFKRIKEQDKAAAKREKDERKAAQRAEKEEAKNRKSMEQRKSREYKRDEAAAAAGEDDNEPAHDDETKERELEPTKTNETTKEKSGRGMFDRIANRLKKHGGDEKKTTTESSAIPQPGERATVEESEKHDDDTNMPVAGIAALSGGAVAAAVVGSEAVPEKDNVSTKDIVTGKNDGTLAGGSYEPERTSGEHDVSSTAPVLPEISPLPTVDMAHEPEHSHSPPPAGVEQEHPEVPVRWIDHASDLSGESSLASSEAGEAVEDREVPAITTSGPTPGHEDSEIAALGGIIAAGSLGAERSKSHDNGADVEDDLAQRPALHPVTSAEHTGDYTFAGPAGTSGRPDLERHISRIPDSSSSSEADDEMVSSDDESAFVGTATSAQPVQAQTETPEKDRAVVVDPTPAPAKDEPAAPVAGEKAATPAVEPTKETTDTKAAPSPAVATGPSTTTERKEAEPAEDKEKKGVRGFFSKFRSNKSSKPETTPSSSSGGRLHKSQPSTSTSKHPSTSFSNSRPPPAGEATTTTSAAEPKPSDTTTPAPTTSAGTAVETPDLPSGPGDAAVEERAASPSSFRRHANSSRDLDDVSSSGAEEEDFSRGRGGERVTALGRGMATTAGAGTGAPVEQTTSNEEQFEEARDHFDESLAPPPAFAAQGKSEGSPARSRFSEDL
ncbi:Eisosome assembly protein [Saxophila tyrrhenica]|uniref:Eisosome assembly protein n=1 Tax=Saxophila tyrrhenica TaxID=1690608 RepID=A0AAV9NZY3_9PEZI|nr:Eisosome assembly protein [Saxophila tyrrhenica]